MADNDPLPANRHKPVMGANDAASGVAVLMELGRLLQKEDPGSGIDLILVDAEDYGAPTMQKWRTMNALGVSALNIGARTWATVPTINHTWAFCSDMVGGDDPEFSIDAASCNMQVHRLKPSGTMPHLSVWEIFSQNQGGSIIDDHYFVNLDAGIPTFDIIDFRSGRGFPKEWHTASDDMSHISRSTPAPSAKPSPLTFSPNRLNDASPQRAQNVAALHDRGRRRGGMRRGGQGCLAGPVYAAAVILPPDFHGAELNDSKQLTARQRYLLRPIIEQEAVAWAVGVVTAQEIDKINILNASILAMHKALDQPTTRPDHLIIDGNRFKALR